MSGFGDLGIFGGFQEDLINFSVMGLSAAGANVAYGYVESFIPDMIVGIHPAVAPAIKIAVGTLVGPYVAGMDLGGFGRAIGTGLAVGLVGGGLLGLLDAFGVPLPVGASISAMPGDAALLLGGAPVSVEEQMALQGAPVSVEEQSALQGFGGFAATLQ